MQLSKKNILAVLRKARGAIHFAGLLREFGGRHIKHELKRMLDDMADDGEIVRFKGNSYSLAARSKASAAHSPPTATATVLSLRKAAARTSSSPSAT